ncbi:hypothetical protein SBA4_3200013 [Candidatus Sulfopaludibacter sp. SbA4]|nr:hypothetical protein SBA4_3200013 [Candidatus Sulfopaludibacter sp. SbA4]
MPTGMKTGVSMVPCAVCRRPARARVCGHSATTSKRALGDYFEGNGAQVEIVARRGGKGRRWEFGVAVARGRIRAGEFREGGHGTYASEWLQPALACESLGGG